MRIDDALQQIDALSAMAQRATTFDGLRWRPIAGSAMIGLVAGCVQWSGMLRAAAPVDLLSGQIGLAEALNDGTRTGEFLGIWIVAAALALSVVLVDMVGRYMRDPTARQRRMTIAVLQRLFPSLAVGAGLTILLIRSGADTVWMLPGLWAIVLGLGVHAAAAMLPPRLRYVTLWYIASGFFALLFCWPQAGWLSLGPLHPLSMIVPFAGGQALSAWLIYLESDSTRTATADSEVAQDG